MAFPVFKYLCGFLLGFFFRHLLFVSYSYLRFCSYAPGITALLCSLPTVTPWLLYWNTFSMAKFHPDRICWVWQMKVKQTTSNIGLICWEIAKLFLHLLQIFTDVRRYLSSSFSLFPHLFPQKNRASYISSILNHCMLSPGQCHWQHCSHLIRVTLLLIIPNTPMALVFKGAWGAQRAAAFHSSHQQNEEEATGPDTELLVCEKERWSIFWFLEVVQIKGYLFVYLFFPASCRNSAKTLKMYNLVWRRGGLKKNIMVKFNKKYLQEKKKENRKELEKSSILSSVKWTWLCSIL